MINRLFPVSNNSQYQAQENCNNYNKKQNYPCSLGTYINFRYAKVQFLGSYQT